MKIKTIILIAVCAVVTLSFTFVVKGYEQKEVSATKSSAEAPAGGFAADDKF